MGHIRIKSLITETKTFDKKAFYQTTYLQNESTKEAPKMTISSTLTHVNSPREQQKKRFK